MPKDRSFIRRSCACCCANLRRIVSQLDEELCEEQSLPPVLIGGFSRGSRFSLETGSSFACAALEAVLYHAVCHLEVSVM